MPTLRLLGSRPAALAALLLALACAHPVAPPEMDERPRESESPAPPPPAPLPAPPPTPPPAPSLGELHWPVRGRIGSAFGARRGRHLHQGVDILAPPGTRVVAAAAGRVSFSGAMRGYGNMIVVEHAGGLETRYAHLRRRLVRKGDRVERGQVIGDVGATGNATTPHLHFEVREQKLARNPLPWLATSEALAESDSPAAVPQP